MIKIVIIGSGNVAQHLIKAFLKSTDIELLQVFSRSENSLLNLLPKNKITTQFSKIVDADLYIISVTDDAIENVSNNLVFKNKFVVHTSGSVSIEDINSNNRKGVFYPLQTFTKNKEVNFKNIPICLEALNKDDYSLLLKVANSISNSVFNISSEQRKSLHVAAVFVCNFTNHMYAIGDDICKKNNIPFDILKPLITETALKIGELSPKEAQTGPAKRNDTSTIDKHILSLDNATQKTIYKLLTQSIQNNV